MNWGIRNELGGIKVELKELKIFNMDCGYRGSITVAAYDVDDARQLMRNELNYSKNESILEIPFKRGILQVNYGDL